MNPIDSNVTIRQPRSDADQVDRRAVERDQPPVTRSSGPDATGAGESVSFTNTAADLLSLENQLRELPGIDQARVDTIRQAISDGSYQINPEQIVDSLLQSEVELG